LDQIETVEDVELPPVVNGAKLSLGRLAEILALYSEEYVGNFIGVDKGPEQKREVPHDAWTLRHRMFVERVFSDGRLAVLREVIVMNIKLTAFPRDNVVGCGMLVRDFLDWADKQ